MTRRSFIKTVLGSIGTSVLGAKVVAESTRVVKKVTPKTLHKVDELLGISTQNMLSAKHLIK